MTAKSSIKVGVSGNRVWIRVIGKGNFQDSTSLKKFITEMIERGKSEIIFDMNECEGMDSTFMGTLAGTALRLSRAGAGHVHMINLNERNSDALSNLGLDQLLILHENDNPEGAQDAQVSDLEQESIEKNDQAKTMLEAHEALVEAAPENLNLFKDVLDYLREDLKTSSD